MSERDNKAVAREGEGVRMGAIYCYGMSSERFCCAEFATRDDALLAAWKEFENEYGDAGGSVWTGVAERPTVESLLPDASDLATFVIEHAMEQACEVFEDAEWPDLDAADEKELGAALEAALLAFAKARIKHPTFFRVEDIQEHTRLGIGGAR